MASDFFARIRGDRQTIGIDVGHYSIKMVRVAHGHDASRRVLNADIERLPQGVIVDSMIQDQEQLREALTRLIVRNFIDLPSAEIVASVNWASGILIDRLSVKIPKNADEDATIIQTAQTRPPFDDQDSVLDYQVLSRTDGEVKTLVVAAKSVMLESWARFFHSANYPVQVLDVDIFGLANAYVATVPDDNADQTVALFNIGSKKANMVFMAGSALHSVCALANGSVESVVNMLTRHLGVTSEKCHEAFEKGEMLVVDGFSETDVESAMLLAFEEVVSSIEYGFRYFSTAESGEKPVKILLAGGGASLPGLAAYITERTGVETDTVSPFKRIACDPQVFAQAGENFESLSNIYAPALGLALRKF
ncbi:MAG: pilus assembly protein PilM [Fibrobacter sp.]|nr:pilus assembly protein PilM [Fibrobacter sp.]